MTKYKYDPLYGGRKTIPIPVDKTKSVHENIQNILNNKEYIDPGDRLHIECDPAGKIDDPSQIVIMNFYNDEPFVEGNFTFLIDENADVYFNDVQYRSTEYAYLDVTFVHTEPETPVLLLVIGYGGPLND